MTLKRSLVIFMLILKTTKQKIYWKIYVSRNRTGVLQNNHTKIIFFKIKLFSIFETFLTTDSVRLREILFLTKVIYIKKFIFSTENQGFQKIWAQHIGKECENFGLDTIQRFPELLKPKSFVKLITQKSFIEQIEELTGRYARVQNYTTG